MPGRRSQPQNGFQLDRTSPFYDGLTAITPNYGGAERVGSGGLLLGSEGWGFESPSSSDYWRVSPTSLASIHPTWTVLTVLQGALTSGSACQYVERPNGTQILKVTGTSGGRPELVLRDAGGVGLLFLAATTTDVTSGAFRRVVAFTRRGTTDHRVYVNGVQEGVDTSTTVPFNFGATDAYVGHDDEDSGEFTAGMSVPLILIWNRSLTAEEMARISENPWQVFEETPELSYLSAPAGGVTTTTATAAAGAATVSAAGSSVAATTATAAAGAATVSGVGKSTAVTTATSADGVATVSGVGAAVILTTATAAAGSATVSAVGKSTAATSGTAAGAATVSGAGASSAVTTATQAAGTATVSGAAASSAVTTATPAAGVATVSGVGSSAAAGQTTAVPAAGVATVSATTSSIATTSAVPASGSCEVSARTPAAASDTGLLGGGPGGPRKRRKGGTESYLERLLSRPLDEYEPEQIEDIGEAVEAAVQAAVVAPQMPERAEVEDTFKTYGDAFTAAYVETYLQMVAEKRQQQEDDDEIMMALASLL